MSASDATLLPPPSAGRKGDEVEFSVIVPVFNQWAGIDALVERLRGQSLDPAEFEIIIVDNGSDPTPDRPARIDGVVLLDCAKPGSYAARNHGVAHARGRWLAFTDADCLPDRDWLAELNRSARGHDDDDVLVAGAVEMHAAGMEPNPFEIFDMLKGIPQARYVKRGYAATANLVVPRSVYDEAGGFDEKRFSGGDADFCRRAGARGHRIVYAPAARVSHPARGNWECIATKARRVKGGQVTAGSRRRRALWVLRTLVPPVRAGWRFLHAPERPVRHKIVAMRILLRVWLLEVLETGRLLKGKNPERR